MVQSAICLVDNFVNKMTLGGELGWFIRDYNPSTGYQWRYLPDNSGRFELVEEITLLPSTDATGVSGFIIWKFKAKRECEGSLIFELYPPGRQKPVQNLIVEIEVKK
jgi:predicted secreted protein